MNSFYPSNLRPLEASAFCFLPLGSIKPRGWLKQQLQIQADGMTGHLFEFWPSVTRESGWLGGPGESWERGPYYLDGLLPLAYLLEDERLLDEVKVWVEAMLSSQDELGHIGPKTLTDWWPAGVALKVLTQYYDVSGDARVIGLMERFFNYMRNLLPHRHLDSWAIMRWADTVVSIFWLYNRNADSKLLDLAKMVMHQGYDWSFHFHDFAHPHKQTEVFPHRTHVVNNAMGIKAPGMAWALTGWDSHRAAAFQSIRALDRYHGTAAGVFTGDEHYAGKDPSQGTELCSVVEYMFSLEHLIQLFGAPGLGDRLEKIAYNALPATFSADMWSHQYDQQANQVLCTVAKRNWTNNSDDSNVFGLEPHYGCCTANYHQGWPKLASHLWMATQDEGLAAVAYAPCEVTARVRGGRKVTLTVDTEYPFGDTIRIGVTPDGDAEFPLSLRIPEWAKGASVRIGGESSAAAAGTYWTVNRRWSAGDVVELRLPMPVRSERRYNDAVTLSRGPLVYSLRIGERWEKLRGEEPHADYEVFPTTDWNYALAVDPENVDAQIVEKGVGDGVIFGPEAAPVEMKVKGRRLEAWQMRDNSAASPPQSPVESAEPLEDVTLVPYGCAKLRITEFPLLKE